MNDEEREALGKVILALDYALWTFGRRNADSDPRDLSAHRQALVDASLVLRVWPSQRAAS